MYGKSRGINSIKKIKKNPRPIKIIITELTLYYPLNNINKDPTNVILPLINGNK